MSYFSIRKRRALQNLPPLPAPVCERAGSVDGDDRLERSRRWLELYHQERAAFKQEKKHGTTDQGEEADARSTELDHAPEEHGGER